MYLSNGVIYDNMHYDLSHAALQLNKIFLVRFPIHPSRLQVYNVLFITTFKNFYNNENQEVVHLVVRSYNRSS